MGRYKMGPNGGYYDPTDTGPDQFTPTPGQQVPGQPAPQAQQPQQQAPPMPDPMQGPWRNAPDAGPGGMTGRMPGDLKQMPQPGGDGWITPAWARPGDVENQGRPGLPDWATRLGAGTDQGQVWNNGQATDQGGWGQPPGGRMIHSPSAHESSWVSNEQLANSQRLADEYARTGVMPQMPTGGQSFLDAMKNQRGPMVGINGQQNGAGGPMTALTQPPDFAGQLGGLKDRFAGSNGMMGRLFNKMDIPQAAQGLQNQWQQKTDLANKLQAAGYQPSGGGVIGGALSGLMSRFGTKR